MQTIAVLAGTVLVIAVAAIALGGAGATDPGITTGGTGTAPVAGGRLPDFTAQLPDGTKVSLSSLAGKPLWLTFGASWCPDCRSEAPDVEAVYQKYKGQGLQLVAIFEESGADITAYAGRAGLTFPILVDENGVLRNAYRALGLPTHYFVGADGVIREVRIGGIHPDEMDRAVLGILN
jgi:peroxiredoxin